MNSAKRWVELMDWIGNSGAVPSGWGARGFDRRAADLFLTDLRGRPDDPADWSDWLAALPPRQRLKYARAQQAELALAAEDVEALALELLSVRDELEMEAFFDRVARKVKRAASSVANQKVFRTISRAASNVADSKLARGIGKGFKAAGKVASDIGKAVPMAGTIVKLASQSPIGAFARATYGAVAAAVRGQNIAMGALDGLIGSPVLSGMVRIGVAAVRGDNLVAAAKLVVKAGVQDVREAAQLAAMVAPFVPGIGTGVGAALGAANALAAGKPISEAMVAAVRGSIPGGVIAQAAFDTAAGLATGKRIDQALLAAARNQIPPGPGQAAFDTGLAIAQGKKLQDAVVTGAAGMLPPSPYAADALGFARRALAGDNLGQAALSTAGNAVVRRVSQQGGDLFATVQGRAQQAAGAAGGAAARVVVTAAKPAPLARAGGAVITAAKAAPVRTTGAAAPVATKIVATRPASGAAAQPPVDRGGLEYAFDVANRTQSQSANLFFGDLVGSGALNW